MLFGGGGRIASWRRHIFLSKFSKNAFDNLRAVLPGGYLIERFCRIARQRHHPRSIQHQRLKCTASDAAITRHLARQNLSGALSYRDHLTRKFGLYWPDFKHNRSLALYRCVRPVPRTQEYTRVVSRHHSDSHKLLPWVWGSKCLQLVTCLFPAVKTTLATYQNK